MSTKSPEEIKLLLEVAQLEARVQEAEAQREKLLSRNRELCDKLEQQRADQADIFYHLHRKLDHSQDQISALEQERAELRASWETKEASLRESAKKDIAKRDELIKELNSKVEQISSELLELTEFGKTKQKYIEKIEALESSLEEHKQRHEKEIAELELKTVQEKERLKREMLIKIKETKKNLLQMTENQLDTTTKRTILENEQMATELQYQSKETEKLLGQLRKLRQENSGLRREVELSNAEKQGHAERANLYWNLSKVLKQSPGQTQIGTEVVQEPRRAEEGPSPEEDSPLSKRIAFLQQELKQAKAECRQSKDVTKAASLLVRRILMESGELTELQREGLEAVLRVLNGEKVNLPKLAKGGLKFPSKRHLLPKNVSSTLVPAERKAREPDHSKLHGSGLSGKGNKLNKSPLERRRLFVHGEKTEKDPKTTLLNIE